MNKIPNRKAICDVLMKKAAGDKDIVSRFARASGKKKNWNWI